MANNNIECWLGSFVIFQGIRTSAAEKPYSVVIFRGGGGGGVPTPCPPLSGSAYAFLHDYFSQNIY